MEYKTINEKIEDKLAIIAVFGLGRIGLPTAVEFAHHGFHVIGIDINEKLLEDLKNSTTFIDEPGLNEMLIECNRNEMIEYAQDPLYGTQQADFLIFCLPTPINSDNSPDYSIIEEATRSIAPAIQENQIFIIESSISPRTNEFSLIPIIENGCGQKCNEFFALCACPERADPGKIIDNFDKIPRIVGGSSKEVTEIVALLYQQITSAQILQVSSPGTANAIKLTENIFRDVNIALMNEFAVLYERLNIDINEVIKGCATKYNFIPHYPGPGVGGPCLPANPYYIIKDASKVDYIPFLIRLAREVNDRMPDHVREMIILALNKAGIAIQNATLAILGISYKANVRDIQISPAIKVIGHLKQVNAILKIFDPYYANEKVDDLTIEADINSAIEGVDAIVILTDHNEFKTLDFNAFNHKDPLILIDARNLYEPADLPKGSIYYGIGRALRQL